MSHKSRRGYANGQRGLSATNSCCLAAGNFTKKDIPPPPISLSEEELIRLVIPYGCSPWSQQFLPGSGFVEHI